MFDTELFMFRRPIFDIELTVSKTDIHFCKRTFDFDIEVTVSKTDIYSGSGRSFAIQKVCVKIRFPRPKVGIHFLTQILLCQKQASYFESGHPFFDIIFLNQHLISKVEVYFFIFYFKNQSLHQKNIRWIHILTHFCLYISLSFISSPLIQVFKNF